MTLILDPETDPAGPVPLNQRSQVTTIGKGWARRAQDIYRSNGTINPQRHSVISSGVAKIFFSGLRGGGGHWGLPYSGGGEGTSFPLSMCFTLSMIL